MKRKFLAMFFCIASSIISCKNKTDKNNDSPGVGSDNTATNSSTASNPKNDTAITGLQNSNTEKHFNLNSITPTDKLSGNFPYFNPPVGYHFSPYSGTGKKDYDKEYFLNHGLFITQDATEGKTFKVYVKANDGKEFSKLELEKNFDEFFKSHGAVCINNGEEPTNDEKDRLKKFDTHSAENNYLFSSEFIGTIYTYIFRTIDNRIIWVQFQEINSEFHLTVLEAKTFMEQMSMVPADKMKKEMNQNGKVVLHINFDTDMATLKPDGEINVLEMAKVLKEDNTLKLSIEGHTDNMGNEAYNKQLSIDRANSVKEELVKSGINSDRLTTVGYGSEKPIAPNDNEENKAQNRRVEFVKE